MTTRSQPTPCCRRANLVEVTHIEPLVAVEVHASRRWTSATGARLGEDVRRRRSNRPSSAAVLQLPAQAADAPRTGAEDLGGLDPTQLPVQRSQDDLVDFH